MRQSRWGSPWSAGGSTRLRDDLPGRIRTASRVITTSPPIDLSIRGVPRSRKNPLLPRLPKQNAKAIVPPQQMQEEEREARVAIGVPLILPPQQMRAEHEAWVAIGVPITEPLPQRKHSSCEKQTARVRCVHTQLDRTRANSFET